MWVLCQVLECCIRVYIRVFRVFCSGYCHGCWRGFDMCSWYYGTGHLGILLEGNGGGAGVCSGY